MRNFLYHTEWWDCLWRVALVKLMDVGRPITIQVATFLRQGVLDTVKNRGGTNEQRGRFSFVLHLLLNVAVM